MTRSHSFQIPWLLVGLALVTGLVTTTPAATNTAVIVIADLVRPDKLATLRTRGANSRVQKCVYWLAMARAENADPVRTLDHAVRQAGYTNALAAQLTRDALLRNLDIADKLGCLDAAGLAEMRKGKAPTIRRGPYAGQELSVDHIIPRSVCVELDNVIANLELMPLPLNKSKSDRIGARQIALAKTFSLAGLLSPGGARKVQAAIVRPSA